ncbi:chemotaxis protein CheB [Methylogaea oryzae]|uniref:protein-glutamate methylesterase n=1 Tax=Methylogaea oryzae TaxID=1295382 RepID=A0A8D4VNP8_9GAMM|nr:chemotaxis protein CheB [Methylogaea oryzae]BBL70867.1 putative chemotaxis protein-glutamate methylesterase [Methylogaea oryzae]
MYRLLTIGFSAGGIPLAQHIFAALPASYPMPIAVVAHLPAGEDCDLVEVLASSTALRVVMAEDKSPLEPGMVYVAPPDYHLLVEKSGRLALSVDPPVKSVRPSIDVLFQSAAEAFEKDLIAVALSGANSDGVQGMAAVKELGGLTIVLDPLQTDIHTLPAAVVEAVDVDYVANIEEIASLLRAALEQA